MLGFVLLNPASKADVFTATHSHRVLQDSDSDPPEALKVLASGEYDYDLQLLMAYIMGVLWFVLLMFGMCLCFNTNTYFLCC